MDFGMAEKVIRVWDLPTRAFHWLLLVLVVAAFVTGLQGGNLMVWHGRAGLLIGGLLAFRLVWGVIGSTYARFTQFVHGPAAIAAYLRGQWQGVGHNPLGAVSVLCLLAVLAFQVGSGLVSNDDIAFNGPLYPLATKDTSDWLTSLHRRNMWVIVLLVVLHIGAVLYHVHVKRDNLVKSMLTGCKPVSDPTSQAARGGTLLALMAALATAIIVMWMLDGGLLPPVPSPSPVETLPNW